MEKATQLIAEFGQGLVIGRRNSSICSSSGGGSNHRSGDGDPMHLPDIVDALIHIVG